MLTLLKDTLRPLYHFLTNRNHRTWYWLVALYGSDRRYTRREFRFQGYTLEVTDSASVCYQFKEIFVNESYRFTFPNDHPVIFDCGANVGMGCIYFRKIFPNAVIHAFEADPGIFDVLQKNMIRNGLDTGVKLYSCAIWKHNGEIEFNNEGADAGQVSRNTSGKVITVKAARLRDLIEKHRPDFIKIDIEGAETEVLLDCDGVLNGVSAIFVEYHSPSGESQQLDQLLHAVARNGFRYYVESPTSYKAPFGQPWKGLGFDLQLNIYCYRPE